MTGAEALRAAIPRLRAVGIEDAAQDARRLLAHAAGIAPARLTLHLADPLPDAASAAFEAAIIARAARQPVAQIIGQRLFHGHLFGVNRDVLDPRPETEILVEEALRQPFTRMLDLGTGSGCILLSCLLANRAASGHGTDVSPEALRVATDNAARLGLAARASFQVADWFRGVSGRFDLIVSNPPYIAASEMAALQPEVRDWEPHCALTPGGDGLAAYRAIAKGVRRHLNPGGRLIVEIGPVQAAAVSQLFRDAGLESVTVHRDMDGRDRVVACCGT
jgi:release factor glutamine methyltransferase